MLSALFVPQRAKLDRAGPGGTATSQILKCKGGGFTSSRDAYNEAVELWIGGYAAAARSTVGVAVGSAAPDVREALQALRARITDRAARALVLHRGLCKAMLIGLLRALEGVPPESIPLRQFTLDDLWESRQTKKNCAGIIGNQVRSPVSTCWKRLDLCHRSPCCSNRVPVRSPVRP
eukprot:gene12396-biopygen10762